VAARARGRERWGAYANDGGVEQDREELTQQVTHDRRLVVGDRVERLQRHALHGLSQPARAHWRAPFDSQPSPIRAACPWTAPYEVGVADERAKLRHDRLLERVNAVGLLRECEAQRHHHRGARRRRRRAELVLQLGQVLLRVQ